MIARKSHGRGQIITSKRLGGGLTASGAVPEKHLSASGFGDPYVIQPNRASLRRRTVVLRIGGPELT